jgi:hypothetical protein
LQICLATFRSYRVETSMGETQHTYKGSCRLERLCPELRIPESGHCLKRLAMGAHLIRVSLYAVESTACNATTIRLARLFCNVVLLKIKDKRRVKKILMGAKSGQKSTCKAGRRTDNGNSGSSHRPRKMESPGYRCNLCGGRGGYPRCAGKRMSAQLDVTPPK